MEANFGPMLDRLGEKMRSEFAREAGRDGFFKEKPDVAAVTRTRALQGGWHVEPAARLKESSPVGPPVVAIKVHRQKKAGFVLKHGVNAHDEIAAQFIPARKMPANRIVGHGKKATVRAIRAFDSWLFAHATDPFVGARGGVTDLARLAALEVKRINVFPP